MRARVSSGFPGDRGRRRPPGTTRLRNRHGIAAGDPDPPRRHRPCYCGPPRNVMKSQRTSRLLPGVTVLVVGALGCADAALAAHRCVPTPTRQCLVGGRFAVEASLLQGRPKPGKVIPLPGTQAVAFGFSPSKSPELVVKLRDGRKDNGYFWVFYAGLTSAHVKIKVTDTVNGTVKSYDSP